jgi:hypothetical protein
MDLQNTSSKTVLRAQELRAKAMTMLEKANEAEAEVLDESRELITFIVNLAMDTGMGSEGANIVNAKSYLKRWIKEAKQERAGNEQWAASCGYTSHARAKMAIGARSSRNEVLASKVPDLFRTLPPTALVNKTHSELGRMQRFLPAIHRQLLEAIENYAHFEMDADAELLAMANEWERITDYKDLMQFHSDLVTAVYDIEEEAEVTEKDLGELVAEVVNNDDYFGRFFKEELLDELGANPVMLPIADWTFISNLPATLVLVAAANHAVAPGLDSVVFENLFTAFCRQLVDENQAVLRATKDEEVITYRCYNWSKSVDLEQLQSFITQQINEESNQLLALAIA